MPRPAAKPKKHDRYTLPTAQYARRVMIDELMRHGYVALAAQYADGSVREKGVMSRLDCKSLSLEARGQKKEASVARGVALLAAFLHEGKHQRPASAYALRAFWAHYQRVHP